MILIDTNVVSELMRRTQPFCRRAGAVSASPLKSTPWFGRTSPDASCPSTAPRPGLMRRLPPRAAPWAGQSWKPIARLPPSPARGTPRWRPGMPRTSSTAASRSSTHGRETGHHPEIGRAAALRPRRLYRFHETVYSPPIPAVAKPPGRVVRGPLRLPKCETADEQSTNLEGRSLSNDNVIQSAVHQVDYHAT